MRYPRGSIIQDPSRSFRYLHSLVVGNRNTGPMGNRMGGLNHHYATERPPQVTRGTYWAEKTYVLVTDIFVEESGD